MASRGKGKAVVRLPLPFSSELARNVSVRPLPSNGRRGGQWAEHRTTINGILWKLRTDAPWRDLPACYGPWQTCYDRFFVRWRRDGAWDRLLAHVPTQA